MRHPSPVRALLPVLAALAPLGAGPVAPASAATIHDESVGGDLSSDPAAPTALAFAHGSNLVTGTVQGPGDIRDYLTFTLAPGRSLVSILLVEYQDLPGGGPGNTGFAALNAGSTSEIPSGTTIGSFLGSDHVEGADVGSDLLAALALAPTGGTGFTPPLGPGSYSFLLQQTGTPLTGYALDFVVVPEPASAALLLAGLGALAARPSRRER